MYLLVFIMSLHMTSFGTISPDNRLLPITFANFHSPKHFLQTHSF